MKHRSKQQETKKRQIRNLIEAYLHFQTKVSQGSRVYAREKNAYQHGSKRRYNERVYTQMSTPIPKETAAVFKAKWERAGLSQRSVLIQLIEEYIAC